jgi:hypothetical protein
MTRTKKGQPWQGHRGRGKKPWRHKFPVWKSSWPLNTQTCSSPHLLLRDALNALNDKSVTSARGLEVINTSCSCSFLFQHNVDLAQYAHEGAQLRVPENSCMVLIEM